VLFTDDHFQRRSWSEPWDYPSKSLVNLNDIPLLNKAFHEAETTFNGGTPLLFARHNYWVAPAACVLYLVFVYVGPKLMESRKPWDLRNALKVWNLGLAIFSFIGTIRVLPHLGYMLWSMGWEVSMCTPPVFTCGHGACGLWAMFFIYSKYFELIDTLFIVLRKKPLSFLHWYHHVTVLLYTWDAYVQEQPPGLYFIAMNYTVHAIMYFYYFLASVLSKPPKWAVFVTILQISQMFIGMYVTGWGLYYSFNYVGIDYMEVKTASVPLTVGCAVMRYNLYAACLMYSTYIYLFAEFFIKRYWSARRKSHSANNAGCQTQQSVRLKGE